jgi:hypothetical protein
VINSITTSESTSTLLKEMCGANGLLIKG